MTKDIPKTETTESQALQNAISGKVHDISSPGPCWVQVYVKGGRSYLFNVNDALAAMAIIKLVKDSEHLVIKHRKDWQ